MSCAKALGEINLVRASLERKEPAIGFKKTRGLDALVSQLCGAAMMMKEHLKNCYTLSVETLKQARQIQSLGPCIRAVGQVNTTIAQFGAFWNSVYTHLEELKT